MTLKKKYENVCNEYISRFCRKNELTFEGWVGNEIGGVAVFGDEFFFNFHDIVWDINSKQPQHLIIDWIYESIDNYPKSINYYSYTKGLRYSDLTE